MSTIEHHTLFHYKGSSSSVQVKLSTSFTSSQRRTKFKGATGTLVPVSDVKPRK